MQKYRKIYPMEKMNSGIVPKHCSVLKAHQIQQCSPISKVLKTIHKLQKEWNCPTITSHFYLISEMPNLMCAHSIINCLANDIFPIESTVKTNNFNSKQSHKQDNILNYLHRMWEPRIKNMDFLCRNPYNEHKQLPELDKNDIFLLGHRWNTPTNRIEKRA